MKRSCYFQSLHFKTTDVIDGESESLVTNILEAAEAEPSREASPATISSGRSVEARCREERNKAIASFTRMADILVNEPSESHARHLEKLAEKLSKIQTTGQAMDALIGITSSASRTLRCGGTFFLLVC